MKLDEIGFYTLTDERAMHASAVSPLWRGEIIVTGRCNFNCIYCHRLPPRDIEQDLALDVIGQWLAEGLRNIRFSGGEPTLYQPLSLLVRACRAGGVEHIGISSNGSAPLRLYKQLIGEGVNDIAISLDASQPALAKDIARANAHWQTVIENIRALAKLTYVTASIVLSGKNADQAEAIISLAHALGVADIRFVTASHDAPADLTLSRIPPHLLAAHPILKYRLDKLRHGRTIRGLQPGDAHRCYLALDDCVVAGKWHYPCAVYFREGGAPIGELRAATRQERLRWLRAKDTHADEICRHYCADFYVEYNNRFEEFLQRRKDRPAYIPVVE